jgi:hypothetical protein
VVGQRDQGGDVHEVPTVVAAGHAGPDEQIVGVQAGCFEKFVGCAGLGAVVVSQPFNLSMWESAGLAGVAAGFALVKGVIARVRGDGNSASLIKGV